jgi:hypothetical protein
MRRLTAGFSSECTCEDFYADRPIEIRCDLKPALSIRLLDRLSRQLGISSSTFTIRKMYTFWLHFYGLSIETTLLHEVFPSYFSGKKPASAEKRVSDNID